MKPAKSECYDCKRPVRWMVGVQDPALVRCYDCNDKRRKARRLKVAS